MKRGALNSRQPPCVGFISEDEECPDMMFGSGTCDPFTGINIDEVMFISSCSPTFSKPRWASAAQHMYKKESESERSISVHMSADVAAEGLHNIVH